MSGTPRPFRWSRESRLLLVTVTVCALALIVLARLRFPEPPPVDTSSAPLERLASRASYAELAADIQRVESLIAPNLIVLRVAPQRPFEPRRLPDVLAEERMPVGVRHVAALRTQADMAVAVVEPGMRIDGIVSVGAVEGTASVLMADPIRHIARIRVPGVPVRPLPQVSLTSLRTPLYVVVVEGTQAGVTLRPVFLGRGDRFGSPRWSRALLPLGGAGVTPGALLFTLAGEFIGAAVMENGAPAVAGAADVIATADALASGHAPAPFDFGITAQRLTPALAAALDVNRGVVISTVDPGGPAAGVLDVLDVVTAVGDLAVNAPDELLVALGAPPESGEVTVTVLRGGQTQPVTLRATVPAAPVATPPPARFTLQRGVGTRVVGGGTDAELLDGDVVVRAGSIAAPTPAQLRRLLAQPTPSGFVPLVIRRQGAQRVVAVPVTRDEE